MKMLRAVSIASVLCTVPIWLFVVPQLILAGIVEVNGGIEVMMVLPTLIGLPCALAGAIIGTAVVLQQRPLNPATILMTLGQITTMAIAAAIVVWAFGFPSTGWELIALPSALMVGQLVVAAGLIVVRRQRGPVPA